MDGSGPTRVPHSAAKWLDMTLLSPGTSPDTLCLTFLITTYNTWTNLNITRLLVSNKYYTFFYLNTIDKVDLDLDYSLKDLIAI